MVRLLTSQTKVTTPSAKSLFAKWKKAQTSTRSVGRAISESCTISSEVNLAKNLNLSKEDRSNASLFRASEICSNLNVSFQRNEIKHTIFNLQQRATSIAFKAMILFCGQRTTTKRMAKKNNNRGIINFLKGFNEIKFYIRFCETRA